MTRAERRFALRQRIRQAVGLYVSVAVVLLLVVLSFCACGFPMQTADADSLSIYADCR